MALLPLLFLTTQQRVQACPSTTTTTTTTKTTVRSSSIGIHHDRALMVDGVDTVPGRFPYHVQVGCCSGVLIAPDVVLTAAHDVPPLDVVVGSKVSVGAYHTNQLLAPDGDAVQVRTVQAAFVHPLYTVIHNDFALLMLDEPVTDGTLIRLNRDPQIPEPEEEVTILGTGTFSLKTMERSEVLQEGTTNYLPNQECSTAQDPTRGVSYGGAFLDETNLCTMGGSDGCVFDSGGPIILKGDDAEEDLLLALVSYGVDCADTVYPAVNARISAGAPWIDQMVCQHSIDPPDDFGCDSILEELSKAAMLMSEFSNDPSFQPHFHMSFEVALGFIGLVMIFMGVGIIVLRRKRLLDQDSTITPRSHNHQSGERQQLLSSKGNSQSAQPLYYANH